MFNERKTAQMAAYLLKKRGGRMSHLKLMKLLYLADREAMGRYGMPMTGDRFVSMDQGPVLSTTLNLMDGEVESGPGGWEEWISAKENHELSLRSDAGLAGLDELSQADIDILDSVWRDFGHWGRWKLRDYTHQHCGEWNDPHGTSIPIEYEAVFRALGRSAEEAGELSAGLEAERSLDRLFGKP